jgi:tetratricopeptide (TPR) repeat protein
LTLGWFVKVLLRRARDRKVFIICACIWCGAMLPFVAWILWSVKLAGIGLALTLWFGPIVHYLTALESYRNPLPHYTSAIVKIKFGKYAEAEQAIIKELENCENDFDGWLMLAELYARQFNDVGEAERSVLDLCDDAKTTLSQKSVALHKLADWQLQFREDPVAARRALEEIITRMPGTHLAKMASIRLRQIPATKQEWDEQQDRGRKLKMPALNDALDQPKEEIVMETNLAEAERAANQCVEKLERDPKDTEAREKLARIFAERLGQAELGIEQLELLLEMPDQPANKGAEWVGLMAAWRFKYLEDKEGAEKLLRRLIKDFPQSAQAFAAQRRLKLMEMEAR